MDYDTALLTLQARFPYASGELLKAAARARADMPATRAIDLAARHRANLRRAQS